MSETKEPIVDKGEGDDKVVLIPISKRVSELEDKVSYYMSIVDETFRKVGMEPFKKNNVKFTRVKIPSFKTDKERTIWENTEIDRCIDGYKGMVGKMYFFFNYSWMVNLKKGRFVPDYRVVDNEWFKALESVSSSGNGEGIICVKRRRVGASWKEASDALHDVLFHPFYIVGMNSKSVNDSIELFDKVKFVFDNIPSFLRVKVKSKTKMGYDLSYEVPDEHGNQIKKGNRSKIIVRSPEVSAFESLMLNKWICDEAGKQEKLMQLFSFTEDTMMQETERVGIPVLFGTAGEVSRAGAGLKHMWEKSDVYRLRKFFFAGYMGLFVDEFGNDRTEESIRWIVYERHRRKALSTKDYYDFLQRYPLTIGEAFAQTSEGGLGNLIKITNQIDAIITTPPKATKGKFKITKDKKVAFVPCDDGDVIIYEHSKTGMDDFYVSGCDPADHDDVYNEASDMSLYIMKKPHGTDHPKIVAQYTARPTMANDYYQQAAMMLGYYNNCKVLIERNRFRMISYFNENGLEHLLQTAPQGIIRLLGGKTMTIGITMTKATKEYLEDLVEEYIDDHSEWIPDIDLLKEFPEYGTKNTDRIMGFGLALMMLKEDRTIASKAGTNKFNPNIGHRKTNRGDIVRFRG